MQEIEKFRFELEKENSVNASVKDNPVKNAIFNKVNSSIYFRSVFKIFN